VVLAVLPKVELVEVAEGILEPSDHLGTHPDSFFSKIVHETCFRCSFLIKDSLLVVPLEVYFEGVVEVLEFDIKT